MPNRPPKFFLSFFRWFCHPDLLKYIEGDLLEIFENNTEEKGLIKAKLFFAAEVIRLFRPGIIKPFFNFRTNNSGMIKHNILITIRNFQRHKLTFFVNLIGLTSGLTCALFIYLWVDYEYSIDKFHAHDQQLFRLVSDVNGSETLLNTSCIFADRLKEEIPEIESCVNSSWGTVDSYLSVKDEFLPFKGEFATPEFFNLFSYKLTIGEPNTVLSRPKSVVISEETALILFKSTDVVGKSVDWTWYNYQETLEITGIFTGTPINSSEQFDFVISFDVFEERFQERITRGNRNARSFFKLTEGTDTATINAKIKDYIIRNSENPTDFPFIIPFSSYYLNNQYENGKTQGGRIVYIQLFIYLAIIILIVACINFMNLSTARASTRLKEMGIKKVIGSDRRSLIFQHFSESLMINIISGIVAIGLVLTFLPEFRAITGKAIYLTADPFLISIAVTIIFTSGIFSGIYPALYLSGFSPILVLKGKFNGTFKDQWLRKGLVIFQFCISLILIVAVLIIQDQVSFLRNKDLGYDKNQLISLSTKGLDIDKRISFIAETKRLPGIANASGITHALFGAQRSTADLQWQGKNPETLIWFDQGYVYYDMLELLEIPMLYGRSFSKDFRNERNKVILNETALKNTGITDPIGKTINIGEQAYEIIGVTKDFHYHSLHKEIRPTIITFSEILAKIVVKIGVENEQLAISSLEKLYNKFNSSYPFEYTFHDQDYQQKYITESRVEELSKYFAGLAIIISCLGLFGLATFSVEQRTTEISIRKILGASSNSLFYLLSKDYLILISMAILIGIPTAIVFMENWLQNFAYHLDLNWHGFFVAVCCIFILSFLVISIQVIKASIASPVKRI